MWLLGYEFLTLIKASISNLILASLEEVHTMSCSSEKVSFSVVNIPEF